MIPSARGLHNSDERNHTSFLEAYLRCMDASAGTLFQLSLEACERRFRQAQKPLEVERPVTVGDGIEVWSESHIDALVHAWSSQEELRRSCAFWIPASGAATRMFGQLMSDAIKQSQLWNMASQFALGKLWKKEVGSRFGPDEEVSVKEAIDVLMTMVDEGSLPKGLLPFHSLDSESSIETAFEAHLRLWQVLNIDEGKVCFTVSPSYRDAIAEQLSHSPLATGVELEFQIQDSETDTPVRMRDGQWLRDSTGEVVRRPGGHGALLPLLEEVQADFVVIRNIDNAPSPKKFELRLKWTQAMLAEMHAWVREREEVLASMRNAGVVTHEAIAWLQNAGMDESVLSKSSTIAEVEAMMDRPMRLVGVVKNQGQVGGGPYWLRIGEGMDKGQVRPQIVESVELTGANEIWKDKGTHFNPVDMICAISPGQSLSPFVDQSRFLKSTKSIQGEMMEVLEHPGLWNGGMSGWLTRFVEMPSECFQPVKNVFDFIGRD